MFSSCGYGSVLERKRYGWRKATKAQNSLAEKIIPADHKRTHAEIARKGKQSSHDTGTLHWNSMKHSVVCLCKAEGKSSKHRSGWAKPPTPTITSAEIKKIKTKNHYKTPLPSRLLTFLNAKGPVRTGGGRTIFSPVSSAQSLTQTCSLL